MILEHNDFLKDSFKPINIIIDGVKTKKFVASDDCFAYGTSYICNMNHRGYIINDPYFDAKAPNFFKPNLLGGSVQFEIDLSKHECGCMSTLYLVGMPAKTRYGFFNNKIDDYFYCSAKKKEAYCPEMDLM